MNCPKCGGNNVEVNRESSSSFGTSAASGKLKRRRSSVSGIAFNGQNTRYKTIALCHDCGYSWSVPGEQEENDKKTAKGCLVLLFLVVFVSSFIFFMVSGSDKTSQDGNSSTERWASAPSPLSDFEATFDGNTVYLDSYTGESTNIWIPAVYESEGTTYTVSLEDLHLIGTSVESVILGDGITSTNNAIFNSTKISRIYIPESLYPVYDNTLAYINDSLTEIYYGGSETAWESAFQEYSAGSAQEHFANGEYEEAGAALASDLNDAIGHDFTTDGKTITFNAKISELQ